MKKSKIPPVMPVTDQAGSKVKTVKVTDLGEGNFRITVKYADPGRSRVNYTGRGSLGLLFDETSGLAMDLELYPAVRVL